MSVTIKGPIIRLSSVGHWSYFSPKMKPRAFPLSSRSQERPVAMVLWLGGNQAELTREGMVTAKGPMLPLMTPEVWARILKMKPESGRFKKSHWRQRMAAARNIMAEQMRPPSLVPWVSMSQVTGTEKTRNMISPLQVVVRLDCKGVELPVAEEPNVTVIPVWVGVVH